MPVAERAARAVHERNAAVGPLALAALTAQLFNRLDDQEDAAHAGMVRREPAAVRIDRQLAAELDASARHERSALALLAESEVLERDEHGDGERVVDHRQLHVAGREA